MNERPSFDSDTMIKAALAKCGKMTLTPDECEAAKQQTIIVNHDDLIIWVVLKEDWDRWANLSPREMFEVEPPQ